MSISDRLLFARFFQGSKAYTIRQLWDVGYKDSRSRPNDFSFATDAEFFLLCRLAYFVGDDAERILRLYRRSALSKAKEVKGQNLEDLVELAIESVGDDLFEPTEEDLEVLDELGQGPICDLIRSIPVDAPDYRHCFLLGRHLKSHPEKDVEATVERYAGLIGRDYCEFMSEFDPIFDAVEYGEDDSRWAEAVRLAEEQPYPVGFLPEYQKFTSITYHLAKINGGVFWLNLKGLDTVFGKSTKTYYNWRLRLVDKDQLITCVDDKYDHRTGKSQVFAWTGPDLPVLAEEQEVA